MDKDEYDENEIQWYSDKTFSGGYEFQMYAVNVPYGEAVPILPFLKISKVTIAGWLTQINKINIPFLVH